MKKKKMESAPRENVLEEALYKKAIGYDADEVVEEYSVDENGKCILTKKKVTKKHISPDIPAAKTLLTMFLDRKEGSYADMSDIELEQERKRLLKLLENGEEIEENDGD